MDMIKKIFDAETVAAVYDFLGHEEETEIRVIDPHKRRRPRSVFVRTRSKFVKTCERYNGLYNVYVGLNERRPGGTRREDVLSVKSIVVDLDAVRPDKSEPATNEELQQVYSTAEQVANDSVLFWSYRPSICMSGNGYQLWYAIPPIRITDENREEVEDRIQSFHRLLKSMYESEVVSIDNIGDLPRIVKVIGTLSIKGRNTEERPHRLSYCFDELERREDPYLKEYVLSLEPESSVVVLPREIQGYTTQDFDQLLERDTKLRSLFHGDVSDYPSRSEAEMALMVKLVYYGFPQHHIWKIMQSAQIGKWQESPDQYRELTYRKALEYMDVKRAL